MSKGNLFQGMGRGKVGDVVFSRLDGEQIARVRNRHPRNPRTNAQLYQRAIMATVMRAYSAGKQIFDHSFEGLSVGAANQREFMRTNARLLRSIVASEIAESTAIADQLGRVVAPGVQSPVPFEYVVSKGTYQQAVFDADFKMPAPTAGETQAQYCARIGLVAGDYYTLVAFGVRDSANVLYQVGSYSQEQAKQYAGEFGFVRLKVKDSVITGSAEVTANSTKGTFFEAEEMAGIETAFMFDKIGDALTFDNLFGETATGAFGVIRSRKDQDLRSDTTLVFTDTKPFGIASSYALEAWSQGTQAVGDSSLILEGGDF